MELKLYVLHISNKDWATESLSVIFFPPWVNFIQYCFRILWHISCLIIVRPC